VKIGNRVVGNGHPPLIVAEMSANHNQSLDRALEIVDAAAEAGADALKIQTYTADTITLDIDEDEFFISDPNSLWKGKSLYKLYQEAYTPWEWHEHIFERCRHHGIIGFSSPFDKTAVDYLENLDVPCYKIASFELVDLPLIKYVAATGKPMILSTGMANTEEIHEAIDTARLGGCKEIAVLHCVSGYPAPAEDYNLRVIPDMIERYGLVTGLSDHTLGNITAITSIAMGASIIEKHFTLDKNNGGPDDSFSLEPEELENLCKDSKTAWESLGQISYERKKSERKNAVFRRSLYVVRNIKAGEIITKENVRSIRPGFGIAPKFFEQVMGRVALHDIGRGKPLSMEDLE
jgi:N-acetylneuraminate synthase